jgi:hypothetical protein
MPLIKIGNARIGQKLHYAAKSSIYNLDISIAFSTSLTCWGEMYIWFRINHRRKQF